MTRPALLGRVPWLAAVALALLALARPAAAWDWRQAFDVRDGAVIPAIEVAASAVLPLETLPSEAHGFGGRLQGRVNYVDDVKFARLEILTADFHLVYRPDRLRYDAGAFPTLTLFGLSSQLRLTEGAHLLYGASLLRAGAMAHSSSAGLSFRLGVALPLIGRDAPTMGQYRRSFLQVETLPLVGSFLTNLGESGFFDHEIPSVQLQGEVALVGRLRTIIGTFDAETRLSASYMRQHSMFLRIRLRWTGHIFWRRFAGMVISEYTIPLRPLWGQESEDARRLLYNHHFSLSIGLTVYLGDLEWLAPQDRREHRRRRFEEHWDERRAERRHEQRRRRDRQSHRSREAPPGEP